MSNDSAQEERQERFRLHDAVGEGEDEHGPYKIVPLAMVLGGKLTPTKVYTDPVKHVVTKSKQSPRGWYKDKTYDPPRKRPRPCYTEAMLTTPYGGYCPVGCTFCYVTHGTRGYRATGIATVNPDYPDYMKMALGKLNIASAAYISSFTEPFQHLEARHHVTQRLSEVLVEAGLPLFYLTRLIPPDWAVDAMLANPYSYMQWSINTSNETHRRRMSPGTSRIEVILDKIGELRRQDIFVSIQCNPVLAGITSLQELVDLVHLVAGAGAGHIIFKFAEQVYSNRALLIDRLTKHRLPNVEKFNELMNQNIGGVCTIDQKVRLEWLDVLLAETRDAGITMSTCYEYYDDGHAGANYAPFVTTSDQCHGKGVPIFYRPEPGADFEPLAGCYRKGCLYCADHGTKVCENETLLAATALEYKDLREITIEGHFPCDWDWPGSCLSPNRARKGPWWNPDMQTDAELWGWNNSLE